ncbi:MAG: plastocyanin/azurin family copper-binding protein [Acidimicrobiales bacterium]
MARRRIGSVQLAGVVAAAALLVAGCSGEGGNSAAGDGGGGGDDSTGITITPGGDPDPGEADIEIHNFRFEPEEATVSAGDSVTWVNEGSAPHTVTFSEELNSGTIRTGNGFTHTFEEPGEYEYWCNNHPGMEGTLIVE